MRGTTYMPKMVHLTELLAKLHSERADIDSAIRALMRHGPELGARSQGAVKQSHHVRVPKPDALERPKAHVFTQAERKHLSKKLKAYWAAKRKAAAKS
jgi:hypothetical protein